MSEYKGGRPCQPARTKVQTVACPLCHAAPGQSCIGKRGKERTSNHMERVERYEEDRKHSMTHKTLLGETVNEFIDITVTLSTGEKMFGSVEHMDDDVIRLKPQYGRGDYHSIRIDNIIAVSKRV